jgi:hypothetical protein
MKVLVSFQKEFWKCPECGEKMPIQMPHKCANIRIRKFISKRIFKATVRNSIFAGLIGIIGFMAVLIYINWKIIAMQNETLKFCKNEMEIMTRTTAVILDTQTDIKSGRGWKPDETFYTWITSLTNGVEK